MKIVKKLMLKIVLTIMCFIAINTANAQTDVKIMDLSLLQLPQNNVQNDSVELMVSFKLNKANKAAKAHFSLATTENNSDIFIATPVFIISGNEVAINYRGVSQKISGYQIQFKIKIFRQQYNAYNSATLFVETVSGLETSRIVYHKK